MKPLCICLIAILALPSLAAAQTMYRWVDKDGKVFYSDQPPPREIKKVEQRRLGANSIETSGLPYATQQAAQDYPAALYTSPDCAEECKMAREFLNRRGVPFSETSISSSKQIADYRKTFGAEKVLLPALTVGSQKQQGFQESLWNGLLDSAGYPRSAAAPAPAAK